MGTHRNHRRRGVLPLMAAGLLSCAGGCAFDGWALLTPKPPPPPADILVMRGEALVEQEQPEEGSPEAKLAGARELFRQGDYGSAGDLFNHLANKDRFPEDVVIEATFYEAECLRLTGRYPKAADTYSKLLNMSRHNPFREQAVRHLFEIANYWLDDTRAAMKEAREVREGKRWMVTPHFFQFDTTKPFADEEGRAIQKLEQVSYHDIDGSLGLGDKALFLAGSVKFFNEEYQEADHFFTQIHERYKNKSPYAAQAVELATISKLMSTGGAAYDGRKLAEARMMIDTALREYPELAAKREELSRQLVGITLQQAEKDYLKAEFYRRRGHPGSAWFYYQLVRQRYPGTKFFDLATQRMHELRKEMEEKGQSLPPVEGLASTGLVPGQPLQPLEEAPPPRKVEPSPEEELPPPRIAPPPRPLPPSLDRTQEGIE